MNAARCRADLCRSRFAPVWLILRLSPRSSPERGKTPSCESKARLALESGVARADTALCQGSARFGPRKDVGWVSGGGCGGGGGWRGGVTGAMSCCPHCKPLGGRSPNDRQRARVNARLLAQVSAVPACRGRRRGTPRCCDERLKARPARTGCGMLCGKRLEPPRTAFSVICSVRCGEAQPYRAR